MDPSHLDELIELEATYWWHVAKRDLVTNVLLSQFPPPARLVEGGVGSARNLLEFRRRGYEVSGLDNSPTAVANARRRGLTDVAEHDLGMPWPSRPGSIHIAVLLDVLEHTADPVAVLRHAANALAPDGGIVLTVPAYGWLYSPWDRSLGHFCRYTARRLRQQAEAASLRVSWLTHWNAFSLPPAIVVRCYQRLFPRAVRPVFPRVAPAVNRWLLVLAALERWYVRRFPLPFGLSLVAVLRK